MLLLMLLWLTVVFYIVSVYVVWTWWLPWFLLFPQIDIIRAVVIVWR